VISDVEGGIIHIIVPSDLSVKMLCERIVCILSLEKVYGVLWCVLFESWWPWYSEIVMSDHYSVLCDNSWRSICCVTERRLLWGWCCSAPLLYLYAYILLLLTIICWVDFIVVVGPRATAQEEEILLTPHLYYTICWLIHLVMEVHLMRYCCLCHGIAFAGGGNVIAVFIDQKWHPVVVIVWWREKWSILCVCVC